MKSGSNNTITDFLLYDVVGGASPKPRIKTEYFDDATSTYIEFASDIENRNIQISTENKRYASYSFMPPVKQMDMQLNNFGQVYSTGSGNAKASILKKNLKVRCWSGYDLIEGLGNTTLQNGAFTNTAKHFHTKLSSGKVYMDITDSTVATIATASQLGGVAMGSTTYGTLTYGYPGYYTKTIKISEEHDPVSFTANVSTGNFSMRHRVSETSDFSGAVWSDFTTLSAGENTITIDGLASDEYVQYLMRFNNSLWNDTDYITSVGVNYEDTVFLAKRGTFIIDEPSYSDKVKVTGRDYLKKALETEINLPDLTVSKTVQQRLTEVFDRCSIPYDTASWDSIATACAVSNATIAEDLSDKSGWKICDLLMDTINAGTNDVYFTFDENGNAIVKYIETDVEADWVTHYRYNIESVSKNFDSDSQLQRCTVMNKSIIVNSEITLGTFTGTTSGTNLHLTYGTTAMYVRYTDANSIIDAESDRTNTAIDFTVADSLAYNIVMFGCHPKSVTDEIWAESGNSANIIKNDGSTYKRVNPFMSQANAKAFADFIVTKNGNPKFTMTVKQQVNPLLEVGIDNLMVFDKYSYTDNIYGLQEINESWNNPSLKETIKLKDRGFDLGRFIWDRNGSSPGINDLKWSTGLVWSQDLGVSATGDSTDYSGTKSILMA